MAQAHVLTDRWEKRVYVAPEPARAADPASASATATTGRHRKATERRRFGVLSR